MYWGLLSPIFLVATVSHSRKNVVWHRQWVALITSFKPKVAVAFTLYLIIFNVLYMYVYTRLEDVFWVFFFTYICDMCKLC